MSAPGAVAAEAPAPNDELQAMLEQFQANDAILEPTVLQTLRKYVRAGGNPKNVVAALSNNYVGYAHMASLACSWITHAQRSVERSSTAPEGDANGASASAQDEFDLLKEFALEKFDSNAFAGVFARGGSGPPSWLDGLITHRRGRQLIYDLSARHKNCLLLNFAIQKILNAGLQDEECVGSSLAGYFGVFHRMLTARLASIANAHTAGQLSSLLADLQESSCHSQHTYTYTLQILHLLGSQPGGHRFGRMHQELEMYAAQHAGRVVWRMATWIGPGTGRERAAACLLGDVMEAQGSDRAFQTAVLQLSDMYGELVAAPSVDHLRSPALIRALLSAVFAPGGDQDEAALASMTRLIAIAAAGEDVSTSGTEVGHVQACLREGLELAVHCTKGGALSANQQARVEVVLAVPVVAHGVLLHLQATCTDRSWYLDLMGVGGVCVLLATLVDRYPGLHQDVCSLLLSALQVMGNSQLAWTQAYLMVGRQLLVAGRVEMVIDMLKDVVRVADPSVVRQTLYDILEAAAPPYSPWFASNMVQLMRRAGVRRGRESRNLAVLHRLQEFGEAAAALHYQPELDRADATFMAELVPE